MPRRSNRRRKREAPIVGDIEEQLRLQRLAARPDEPPTANPPQQLGNYVHDASRNAYFPRRDQADIPVDIPRSSPPRAVPNRPVGSSWLHASEICANPAERRRIMTQWRSRKLMKTLEASYIPRFDDTTWGNRLHTPFWHSSFSYLPSCVGDGIFHRFRQKPLARAGPPAFLHHRTSVPADGRVRTRTRVTYLDEAVGERSVKTVCNPENEDCFIMGYFIHQNACSEFSYYISRDVEFFPDTFNIPHSSIDDFCALTENKLLFVGHGRRSRGLWEIWDGETEGFTSCHQPSPSATLCVMSFPKSVTQVFSGHQSGQVCLSDLRSYSSNHIAMQGRDPNFGNVVKLNVSSTQVIAQAASGCCRLFDIRNQACLLREFPATPKPQWTRIRDTLCRGMAVDPTNSVLLLPQPMEEESKMSVGLWSLHTGEYLGHKVGVRTQYLELCPIVGQSVFEPHKKAAVWADAGMKGVVEICLERFV